MTREQAIKDIKDAFKVMRENSNQYGVPEWKFQRVNDAMIKAEKALSFIEGYFLSLNSECNHHYIEVDNNLLRCTKCGDTNTY